jgi:hypothetical protein
VGGKVLFSLPASDALVRMSIYDLSGRFVREVMNKSLSKGNYSALIDMRGISCQFYLLRVTINGASSVMRLQPASRLSGGTVVRNAPGFETRLEKLAAVVDTLRATEPGYTPGVAPIAWLTGLYNFTLTKNNTFNGDLNTFWGDTGTYPRNGSYVILNRTNGAFPDSKIFWSIQMNGTKTSIATQPAVQIANGGGRFFVWVAPTDSGSRYFDYIEYNYGGNYIWMGNTTRVDGWRLPIAFRIHSSGGIDTTMGDAYQMFYQSRQAKFDEFRNEVPKEFTGLATQDFANIWAPGNSPVNYFGLNGPFENYFIEYENAVIALYGGTLSKSPTLTVFNAMAPGGGMAVQPNYSAALNRHVATLPQGTSYSNWNNDTNYYKAAPCNYYSKWCHRRSLHNLCYGIPYDDVGNHSSFVQQNSVQWIAIAIGW